MKYLVLLGDGMADWPVPALGGRTPLDAAAHPHMDFLARNAICGLARTVPEGMPPGSDTANLSVFGYDPEVYYSGRSPLEAVNMGIDLGLKDVTYRANTVTLTGDTLESAVMADYSAGELPSAESHVLIADLARELFGQDGGRTQGSAPTALARQGSRELYPGVSYRHCLVLRDAEDGALLTPPHDISGRPVGDFLPKGRNAELLRGLMERSFAFLRRHPLNLDREKRGLNPANCLWFWGEGRKPALPSFPEKYGIRGGVISAVDLLHGIGRCAGLVSIPVDGVITGNWHTDFAAKARAAAAAFDEMDFVYLHIEAPDECGHHGELREKIWSIEQIDAQVLGPILTALRARDEDFAVLLMPDHPTPMATRTHAPDPVPFALYDSRRRAHGAERFTEACCAASGLFVPRACTLMDHLMNGTEVLA